MFYFWFTDVEYARASTAAKILHISILACTPLLWTSAALHVIVHSGSISLLEMSETVAFTVGGTMNACRLALFYARRAHMSQLIRDANQLSAEVRDDCASYDNECRRLRNQINFYEILSLAYFALSGMVIGKYLRQL